MSDEIDVSIADMVRTSLNTLAEQPPGLIKAMCMLSCYEAIVSSHSGADTPTQWAWLALTAALALILVRFGAFP